MTQRTRPLTLQALLYLGPHPGTPVPKAYAIIPEPSPLVPLVLSTSVDRRPGQSLPGSIYRTELPFPYAWAATSSANRIISKQHLLVFLSI